VAKAKRAEDWLKLANADLRDEQLRPFADRTIALWAELRQESNVELLRMRLAGTATGATSTSRSLSTASLPQGLE